MREYRKYIQVNRGDDLVGYINTEGTISESPVNLPDQVIFDFKEVSKKYDSVFSYKIICTLVPDINLVITMLNFCREQLLPGDGHVTNEIWELPDPKDEDLRFAPAFELITEALKSIESENYQEK